MSKNKTQILHGVTFCAAVFAFSLTACGNSPNIAPNSAPTRAAESSAGNAAMTENTNTAAANLSESATTNASDDYTQTIDKIARAQVIEKYIKGVAKVSDASEYKEARKVVYGDLDGDGDEDAAAQFTIEGMGGGNNYGFYLAVFRNDKGKFTAVTDEVIGGKLNRDVDLQKIDNGKILFNTKSYDDDDGACCPSVAGKTSYVLQGNKLIEKKTK